MARCCASGSLSRGSDLTRGVESAEETFGQEGTRCHVTYSKQVRSRVKGR